MEHINLPRVPWYMYICPEKVPTRKFGTADTSINFPFVSTRRSKAFA